MLLESFLFLPFNINHINTGISSILANRMISTLPFSILVKSIVTDELDCGYFSSVYVISIFK